MKKNWTKKDFYDLLTPNKNGCLDWTGAMNGRGYGLTRVNTNEKIYTHRLALQLEGVDIDGLFVLHSCDRPSCCNPKHLRTGTPSENTNDMLIRKRYGKIATINEEQCLEIRRLKKTGIPQWRLGETYGISQAQVSRIVNNAQWKHI